MKKSGKGSKPSSPNVKPSSKKSSVWIHGITGKMGQELEKLVLADELLMLLGGAGQDLSIKPIFKEADIIIDFSSVSGNKDLLESARRLRKKRFLIGTTGISQATIGEWSKVAIKNDHAVLVAPNTSLGVFVFGLTLGSIAKRLVSEGWDVEIIESHHNKKADAPSGTALFLAKMIMSDCPTLSIANGHKTLRSKNTIGIHSVRGGGVVGEHQVRFIGPYEEISLSHRAFSRSLFSMGAISLTKRLVESERQGLFHIEDFA